MEYIPAQTFCSFHNGCDFSRYKIIIYNLFLILLLQVLSGSANVAMIMGSHGPKCKGGKIKIMLNFHEWLGADTQNERRTGTNTIQQLPRAAWRWYLARKCYTNKKRLDFMLLLWVPRADADLRMMIAQTGVGFRSTFSFMTFYHRKIWMSKSKGKLINPRMNGYLNT